MHTFRHTHLTGSFCGKEMDRKTENYSGTVFLRWNITHRTSTRRRKKLQTWGSWQGTEGQQFFWGRGDQSVWTERDGPQRRHLQLAWQNGFKYGTHPSATRLSGVNENGRGGLSSWPSRHFLSSSVDTSKNWPMCVSHDKITHMHRHGQVSLGKKKNLVFCFCFVFFFCDQVFLRSPEWPETWNIDQTGPKLTAIPCFCSQSWDYRLVPPYPSE